MHDFDVLGRAFAWVIQASWQGSVLAVVLGALLRATRTFLSPSRRHALWVLLLICLAAPVVPASQYSLLNLFARQARQDSLEQTSARWAHTGPGHGESPFTSASQTGQSRSVSTENSDHEANNSFRWPTSLRRVFAMLWLAGMGLAIAVHLWQAASLCHSLRRVPPIVDPRLSSLLSGCAPRAGIACPPRTVVADCVRAPALVGMLWPTVVLPKAVAAAASDAELEIILLHELAHLRRRDVAWGMLETCFAVIHWFNPMLRCALGRVRAERELACDALVLDWVGREQRYVYGRTLLKMFEASISCGKAGVWQPATMAGLVSMFDRSHMLRERISMITRAPHYGGRGPLALAAFLAAVTVLLRLTLAATPPQPQVVASYAVQSYSSPNEEMVSPEKSPTIEWQLDEPTPPPALAPGAVRGAPSTDAPSLHIEAVIVTAPMDDLLEACAAIGGSLRVGRQHNSPLAASALATEQTADSLLAGIEHAPRASGRVVVERNLPLTVAVANDTQRQAMIERLRKNPKATIVAAPHLLTPSGRSASLATLSQTPFVVQVVAGKPQIDILNEGVGLRIRPVLQDSGAIHLDSHVELRRIGTVEVQEAADAITGQIVRVQLPEIETAHVDSTAELKPNDSLILCGFPAYGPDDEKTGTAVILRASRAEASN